MSGRHARHHLRLPAPSRRAAHVLAALAAALASGCDGGDTKPDMTIISFPGPPQVVLGTGLFRFSPILPCQRLPTVRGPQGGDHVWGSVRLRYLQPRIELKFTLTDAVNGAQLLEVKWPPIKAASPPSTDGGLTVRDRPDAAGVTCRDGGDTVDMAMAPDPGVPEGADGWIESLGNLMFIPLSFYKDGGILELDGRALRGRIEATDLAGRTGADEKTFYAFTPVR